MVKVDLITGFLGSGKTTFIKKYAQYLIDQGYRIGIIENNFHKFICNCGYVRNRFKCFRCL